MADNDAASEVIELNVGGSHFATLRSTLTKYPDTLLAMLVTTDVPVATDAAGRIFIDRDGTHFGTILQFLRDGHVIFAPKTMNGSRLSPATGVLERALELRIEAEYYGLDALIVLLKNAASANVLLNVDLLMWTTSTEDAPVMDALGFAPGFSHSRNGPMALPAADGSYPIVGVPEFDPHDPDPKFLYQGNSIRWQKQLF